MNRELKGAPKRTVSGTPPRTSVCAQIIDFQFPM